MGFGGNARAEPFVPCAYTGAGARAVRDVASAGGGGLTSGRSAIIKYEMPENTSESTAVRGISAVPVDRGSWARHDIGSR